MSTKDAPEAPDSVAIDRRRFLQTAAAAAAVPWIGPSAHAVARPSRGRLLELTASEAVAAMRAGELRATRYAAALLDRARSLAHLNTILAQDPDRVLATARAADKRRGRGPLHGLPVLVKDNINTRGVATTAGTPALTGNRPRRNAIVVERLLAAGAIVFGKTNLHELAAGVTSNNAATGAVGNPYDPTTIAGGSSGGSAAAVAARIAPAALGTDTGGSVRIPAALCGIASLRPTVGRYPRTGDPDAVTDLVPLSHTRDTPGPMARTVADVALLDAVIAGERAPVRARELRGVRLGVDQAGFFADLDPQTQAVMADALRRLEQRGARLVELQIPDLHALNEGSLLTIGAFEARQALPKYLAEHNPGVSLEELVAGIASPDVRALFALVVGPGAVPEEAYLNALAQRARLQAAYRQAFTAFRVDALVFPTTPLPARPIGDDATVELNGRQVPTIFAYVRHTDPGANAGLPGLSLPAGLTQDGLPVGLAIDGPAGSDRDLLALGFAIERELGPLPPPTPAPSPSKHAMGF